MNNKSRSSLVLMEIIVTVLFFSIASAICINLFVAAHIKSRESKELSNALYETKNMAELIKGFNGDSKKIKNELPECIATPNGITLFYNKDFNIIKSTSSSSDIAYELHANIEKTDGILTINIKYMHCGDYNIIYEITTGKEIYEQ